jgi:hypothetical protein
MRVSYTVPGLALTPQPAPAAPETEGQSFRGRLRRLSGPLPREWKDLLGLRNLPQTATTLGPPPRPTSLASLDAAGERLRWRGTLDRLSREVDTRAPSEAQKLYPMLALLLEYEDRGDALVSRLLSEVRG